MINKYRPKDFEQVVGHKAIIKSLQKVLASETVPHAYLLTGASGCGKTTIARIMAVKLGCTDLTTIEFNCANTSKREDARDIINSIRFRPITGGNLCLILDEAGELSTGAQNTLLKAVEDAPDHVYFIFASTDPQKIIPTLKNRLVKYNIAKLSQEEIYGMIEKMWKAESYPIDDKDTHLKIIRGIAKKCDGVPREAITLLTKLRTLDLVEARELIEEYEECPEAVDIIELIKLLMNPDEVKWSELVDKYKLIATKVPVQTIRIVTCNYIKGCLLRTRNPKEGRRYQKLLNSFLYNNEYGNLEEAAFIEKMYRYYDEVEEC